MNNMILRKTIVYSLFIILITFLQFSLYGKMAETNFNPNLFVVFSVDFDLR